MARLATRVLAATELLHDELLTELRADHFRRDLGAGDSRRADRQTRVTRDSQDVFELDRRTFFCLAIIDAQNVAFFDGVLSAAVGNDGIHGSRSPAICVVS